MISLRAGRWLRPLWLVGLVAGTARDGQAQGDRCPAAAERLTRSTADRLAKRFAPLLHHSPGERYFPTVPFFTAYRSDGLRDPELVAPVVVDPRNPRNRLLDWDRINDAYRADTIRVPGGPLLPGHAAVFYRVRCVSPSERDNLVLFLRNDSQAWDRLIAVDSLVRETVQTVFYAEITYYLYYLLDTGLEGHAQDIERVVVFVPIATEAERQEVRDKMVRQSLPVPSTAAIDSTTQRLVVLVGNGHSATTPNNIFVYVGDEAQLLRHPSVLIELGGHSAAPDRNRDGEFTPGIDINWNLAGPMWGTRDAQAISGLGFLGSYKGWMTFPRRPGTFVTLVPRDDDPDEHPHDANTLLAVFAERAGFRRPPDTVHYNLLPLEPFRRVDSLAGYLLEHAGDTTAAVRVARAELVHSTDSVLPPLLAGRWAFQPGLATLEQAAVDTVIARIAAWRLRYQVRTAKPPRAANLIWLASSFNEPPTATLKRELYRPSVRGLWKRGGVFSLLNLSYNVAIGGTQTAQLGMVVPVFASVITVPGVVELHGGLGKRNLLGRNDHRPQPAFSLIYDQAYKSAISAYLGLDYLDDRRVVEADQDAGDFALVGGISVMPLFPIPDIWPALATRLRTRIGFQIWKREERFTLRRLELRTIWYVR